MARKSNNQGRSRTSHQQQTPTEDLSARSESRRAQRVLQERRAKRKRMYTMFGGVAAAALILALVLILINREDVGTYGNDPVTVPPAMAAGIERDGRTLGDPAAPVSVVEYGDYQCPGCAAFARNVKPQLLETYVANGDVFFEYRDLTGLGPESYASAIGAACALEQGMYWEFHDILYYNQIGRDDGAFSERRMMTMAEQLEMDTDTFEDCLGTDRFDEDLDAMMTMASQDNIRATPSVIVNGVLLEGPNWEQVQQQVEVALQEAGS